MAIAHFSVQILGRGEGRSAVLSAAYRHCARMEFEREARTIDYTRKTGLLHEEFALPPGAPEWVRALVSDRSVAGASESFWNRVEAFEKRADAQLARDVTIALPVELSSEQNIALVRDFVAQHVLAKGMVADWVFHDAPGNPHVHLMTTLRPLTEDGFGPKKLVRIGADGAALRNDRGRIVYDLWAGGIADFNVFRDAWFERQNHHLALGGIDLRIDGRSFERQGIDLVPTVHVGVGATAVERKAKAESRSAVLERIEAFEASCAENLRLIEARPELVLERITSEKSVFDERDLAKVLYRYVDDVATFQRLMARLLQSPQLLRLQRETVAFETGAKLPARYTTRELIRVEADMARRAVWLAGRGSHGVDARILGSTFARHARLSDEQRAAIEHVAAGARIAAVVGRAGAGKTTMMKAAREAWETAGYRVVGAALAGKAAEGLEEEAGIVSRTLASWELRWREGRDGLDARTVFVLDEAGMVASKQMAGFVEAAALAGAKLVLVGDPEQLQPIEAGAAFRAIVDHVGYAELETIYRQQAEWMRRASLDLARGNVAEALRAYQAQGRITGARLKADAVETLISEWNRDYDPGKSTLILAHLRRDVAMLNQFARAKLVERGLVGAGHAYRTAGGERFFAAGDQIVFLKNDSALGVKNGMIGRVAEAAPGRIVAHVGDGEARREVRVEARLYGDVDHGYATTIHKSQGATVDRVRVLASLSLDRHLAYVAMTRHRENLHVHYGRRSFEKNGGLAAVLSRRNAKETTLDYERGALYRHALAFAENRGLHLVAVARTLLRDRLDWTLRQKGRVTELAAKLQALGSRLGLRRAVSSDPRMEDRPMVTGITVFPLSAADSVAEKLGADPALLKQWEEVSSRFRFVFADPEAAFRAMRFEAILGDGQAAREALARLDAEPAAIGALNGRTGILAGHTDREARRVAEANLPALKRELQRYLEMREAAGQRLVAEEAALRRRASIDIPALSPAARIVLERVRDAIDRNDLPAALGFAMADREAKLEIDGFGKAVTERFGERTLLPRSAREPNGAAFETAAGGLRADERERLKDAWPLMRAAQQLAAEERTTTTLKRTQDLTLAQRQSPLLKP